MAKFDISANSLREEGAKAVAEALKGNQIMTELNISGNRMTTNSYNYGSQMSGVMAIADAIPTMGALSKVIFGGDTYSNSSANWEDVTPEPAILEVGMTEADLSNKNLGTGGAIIVGAWIAHKDNGALTSLNVSKNMLCGVDDSGRGTYNPSGVTALADAIGKHQ